MKEAMKKTVPFELMYLPSGKISVHFVWCSSDFTQLERRKVLKVFDYIQILPPMIIFCDPSQPTEFESFFCFHWTCPRFIFYTSISCDLASSIYRGEIGEKQWLYLMHICVAVCLPFIFSFSFNYKCYELMEKWNKGRYNKIKLNDSTEIKPELFDE